MSTTAGSKIERVIDAHGLEISGEDLEGMWTEDRYSVRDLAHKINVEVLDTRLRKNGVLLDEDLVEILAEKMKNDDAVLTEFDLKERGIDVEAVVSDFVSYQTVHNYLTNIRGAELETEVRTPSDVAANLSSLRGRTESVTSQAISALRVRGHMVSPEPAVEVDIRGVCPECGSSTDISVWARQGNCLDCGHGTEK